MVPNIMRLRKGNFRTSRPEAKVSGSLGHVSLARHPSYTALDDDRFCYEEGQNIKLLYGVGALIRSSDIF